MENNEWADVLSEAESPDIRDKGLWARCFAQADGDEGKAKAAYVNAVMTNKAPAPPVSNLGYCPNCGANSVMDAPTCSACKAVFGMGWNPRSTPPHNPQHFKSKDHARAADPEPSGFPGWAWVIVAAVVLFGVFACIGKSNPTADAKYDARQAIKLCWSEQGRKSFDPGTQRFVAGVCEKMEADFERTFNARP